MTSPKPDWYPDPDGSHGERWWDGRQWTRQRRTNTSSTSGRDRPPIAAEKAPSTESTSDSPAPSNRPRRTESAAAAKEERFAAREVAAAPPSSPLHRCWAALPTTGRVAAVVVPVLLITGLFALNTRTDAEDLYLDAMHNPCQHPEIFSGSADYCSFVWQGDESAQIAEGHEICDIQASVPVDARLQASYDYLRPRHRYYTNIQINTQLIAAEHALC